MLKYVDENNFENEILEGKKVILVDFFATWCGPCQILGPILEKIGDSRADFDIAKVDVDKAQKLAIKYGIEVVPTMLIFKDGKVVYVADEPTGGTHFSLVLAGAYRKSFEEAEHFKRDKENHKEILPLLKPVIEKVSTIISQHIEGHQIDNISLVGGTCCLTGIEDIIEKKTGVPTYKPIDPMFVTPLGIAFSCTTEER